MSLVVKSSPSLVAGTSQPTPKAKAEKLPAKLPALTQAEKLEAIKDVTRSLNTEYESTVVQKMGTQSKLRLPSLASGMPTFDEIVMSVGGLPDGRVVEVYGPESSGKTTFCLHLIAMAQKLGEMAAFIDAEHALDPGYAKTLGVDIDNLVISQPDYGEQAAEILLALVKTRAFRIIVVDSVSALVPLSELEGDMTDASMGVHARLMSKLMRKLVGEAHKAGCLVVFINQVREKIGVMFGNPEVTTGGRALKFFSSVRLEVRRLSKTDGGELKDDAGVHIGHRMRVKNVKNKVGPPFRETIVDLMYASGFNLAADVVEYAIRTGVVTKGTQTKDNKDTEADNGVPKTWFGFEGSNYRRLDLTQEPVFGNLSLAAYRARDARLTQPS
jgi:recombination protein RecA